MTTVTDYFNALVSRGGTDLHLKAGGHAYVRISGDLEELTELPALTPEDTRGFASELMDERATLAFATDLEADFAHGIPGTGRFRVNVYKQRGSVGLTVRKVLPEVPELSGLGLPAIVSQLTELDRGLLLVTGPGGSGKTTTIAALVGHINASRRSRVVSIEDPIEFVHADVQSVISQREVGSDVRDHATGLRAARRQDPDVIIVSEIRDVDTAGEVLRAAEAGLLVIAGMATADADTTLSAFVELFPGDLQQRARSGLAGVLLAVLSQRLLPSAADEGQVVAAELLLMTSEVAEVVAGPAGTTSKLVDLLGGPTSQDMQSMDAHLLELIRSGRVRLRDALGVARDPYHLRASVKVDEPV